MASDSMFPTVPPAVMEAAHRPPILVEDETELPLERVLAASGAGVSLLTDDRADRGRR